MNEHHYPIDPEYATVDDEAAYDRWFREQVQAALDDPRPGIPHDQVMAEIRDLIAAKKQKTRAS